MLKIFSFFILIFGSHFAMAVGATLRSVPNSLHFSGHILKSDGTAFVGSNVSFLIAVTSPGGTCILYLEEVDNIDMSSSGGNFELSLGSGTRQYPTATTNLRDIFSNLNPFVCKDTTTYTPVSLDGRKVQIQFNDGSTWRAFASSLDVSNVPYALQAASAETLSTYAATDFVLKTGLPTCTAGTFLSYDGTTLSCAAAAGGGGSVTAVSSANSDIGVAAGSTTPVLTLNAGTAAGQIVKLDATGKLPAVDGSSLTNLSATSLVSGTLPAARLPALTGDITTTAGSGATTLAKLQGNTITLSSLTAGSYLKYNGTNWINAIPSSADLSDSTSLIKASQMPANCGSGQTLVFTSPTGSWNCATVAISGSNFGSQTANTFFAGPSTGSSTPTFRAITAADLPTGISPWLTNGSNIYYLTGNVGIGTSTPAKKLDIAGDLNLSSGSKIYSNNLQLMALNTTNTSFAVGSTMDPQLSGSNNTAVGANSLISAGASVADNTGVGANSLSSNSVGSDNTAVGYNAIASSTSASSNTAIGSNAGQNLTTGGSNVFIGNLAGYNITSGSSNIAIGNSIALPSPSGSGQINIGNTFYGNSASGFVGIGTASPAYRLDVANNPANPTGTYTAAHVTTTPTFSSSSAGAISASLSELTANIGSGITQSGSMVASRNNALMQTGSGTTNFLAGIQSNYGIQSGTGTIVNAYGVQIQPSHSAGTITNSFGLYIASPNTGGTVTNEYGIFEASATAINYFGGVVGIGTITPVGKLEINSGAANANVGVIISTTSAGANTYQSYKANGTVIGGVSTSSGSNISFNTTSDIRLKGGFQPVASPLKTLNEIEVANFYYLADPSHRMDGFKAQQLYQILPYAVTKPAKEVDADGKINPWFADYSKVVPLVTAAVQDFYSQWNSDSEMIHAELASKDQQISALQAENQSLRNVQDFQSKQLNQKIDQQAKELAAIKRKLGL